MKLSIIVCTYNRAAILQKCLQSLVMQNISANILFKVIVINNNSTDATQEVIHQFSAKHHHFKSFLESKQGLSHARNRGYQEAQSDWVAYIDDDAKVHPNFVERALWVIENYDFDCFGGMYYAWYDGKKPKWLPEDFGTKVKYADTITKIVSPKGFAAGGVIVFKKKVLNKLGGFKTEYGMSGNKIGYGEETEIQHRMLKQNYSIGFDPKLKVDHLVGKHKYKLNWHIKSLYQRSITVASFQKPNLLTILKEFIWGVGRVILKKIPALIKEKKIYWQRFILIALSPFIIMLGSLHFYGQKVKKE